MFLELAMPELEQNGNENEHIVFDKEGTFEEESNRISPRNLESPQISPEISHHLSPQMK
jgi:hypothetical protein